MSDQMPKSIQGAGEITLWEARIFFCCVYSQYGGHYGYGMSPEEAEQNALERCASKPEMDLESEFLFNPDKRDDVDDFVYDFKDAVEKQHKARKELRSGQRGEMLLLPRGTTHFSVDNYGSLHWRNVNATVAGEAIELKFADGKWIER